MKLKYRHIFRTNPGFHTQDASKKNGEKDKPGNRRKGRRKKKKGKKKRRRHHQGQD